MVFNIDVKEKSRITNVLKIPHKEKENKFRS